MFVKLGSALVCCLLMAIQQNCDSKSGDNQQSKTAQTTTASPSATPSNAPSAPAGGAAESKSSLDACALLEKSEIESVQGGKVQMMTPSTRDDVALAISQCYYTVISADGKKNLSVHLEVMRNDPKSPDRNAVGELWRERFEGATATKKKEEPKRVPGVGDGAFWLGSSKMGALYALKKDKLLRVSIGGPDEEKAKIEKSKALAEKALKRLS
jgi:hypothetical protein